MKRSVRRKVVEWEEAGGWKIVHVVAVSAAVACTLLPMIAGAGADSGNWHSEAGRHELRRPGRLGVMGARRDM